MFRPSDIVIDAFVAHLRDSFCAAFPAAPGAHLDALVRAVRVGANRIALADALYHDLDHTVVVTRVGEDIMRGKMIRDGRVTSLDWVHFTAALVLFAIGFCRDLVPGDRGESCVISPSGMRLRLPEGSTAGRLWPWFAERGMMFVRCFFEDDPVLDPDRLAAMIDYARFPPPLDTHPEIASYPGLLRAAHLIGAIADPYFPQKLKPLTLELEESGMLSQLGFRNVVEFRAGYPKLFWELLNPIIKDGVDLLEYTPPGRLWLASMRAHLLREEHVHRL
ncbi:MAG TPA: hypothetical protein VEB20_08580 [Azospirillaceae bacterium]|nr:hypothetical protein [Azospirillaceae bacterium]